MSAREVHTDGPVAERAEALARMREGWSAVWYGHDAGWCVVTPDALGAIPWAAVQVIHARSRSFVTAEVPDHGRVTVATAADGAALGRPR